MKTGVIIAMAGAGLVALGAAMHAWPLSGATALRMVQAQLSPAGFTVQSVEGGHLTLLPVPRIDIAAVSIRDADGDVSLRADMLRASIRLASLAVGTIDVADLTLVSPDIELSRDLAASLAYRASGLTRPGSEPALPGGKAGPAEASRKTDLQRLVLTDGRVTTRDGDGTTRLAERINLVVARSAGGDFDISASMALRGEDLTISGSGLRLAPSVQDEAGPLEIVVNSPLVDARLSGRTTGGINAQTDGDLLVKTRSLERLATWLDLALPLPLAGPVEIAGTMRLQPAMLTLSNARIAVGAGQFDGVLALRQAGDHLALDGTVAADTLDLTGALAPLLPVMADGWSRDPYPAEFLPRGDADLRISAGRLTLGRLVLANAALSVLSRGGRTDAVLSSAESYKGTMKARLSLAPAARGIDMKLAGSVERVDLAAMLGAVADQRRLSGVASGSILVEGTGDSPMALVRSLDGKASAILRQGELVGVNLPDLLKRVERRPLATGLEGKGGRTTIETGSVTARIGKGVVDVAEASLNSAAARVLLAGQIGLGDRQLALSGTALTPGTSGQDQIGLPFDILGSFDDPQVVPDAKSLIRRSAAAAPFFQPRPAATETGRIDALAPPEPPLP